MLNGFAFHSYWFVFACQHPRPLVPFLSFHHTSLRLLNQHASQPLWLAPKRTMAHLSSYDPIHHMPPTLYRALHNPLLGSHCRFLIPQRDNVRARDVAPRRVGAGAPSACDGLRNERVRNRGDLFIGNVLVHHHLDVCGRRVVYSTLEINVYILILPPYQPQNGNTKSQTPRCLSGQGIQNRKDSPCRPPCQAAPDTSLPQTCTPSRTPAARRRPAILSADSSPCPGLPGLACRLARRTRASGRLRLALRLAPGA